MELIWVASGFLLFTSLSFVTKDHLIKSFLFTLSISVVFKFPFWSFWNQSNCFGQGHGAFCHVSLDLLLLFCWSRGSFNVTVLQQKLSRISFSKSLQPNLSSLPVFASIYSSLNYYHIKNMTGAPLVHCYIILYFIKTFWQTWQFACELPLSQTLWKHCC